MNKLINDSRWLIAVLVIASWFTISSCDQFTPGLPDTETTGNGIKVLIDREGIYYLTLEALSNAGLELNGIDLRRLRLSLRGVEQSLFIFQDGSTRWFEFFGRESESIYSSSNIYIIELAERNNELTEFIDARQFEPLVTNAANIPFYDAKIHLEENQLYFPQVLGEDHWFWVSIPGGQSQSISFSLPDLATGEASLQLYLWGNTEAPENPDHHVRVKINEQTVLDTAWDGKGAQFFEAKIRDDILTNGDNHFLVETIGDTRAAAEVNWINWIEIEYPRYTIAQSGGLKFAGGGNRYRLSGFDGEVHVYDITSLDRAEIIYAGMSNEQSLEFNGLNDHTYWAVDTSGYSYPLSLTARLEIPDLNGSDNGADYLVIGPDHLLSAIDELLAYRADQGLQVRSVSLQAIYDKYNYGFPEPEAIRAFLVDIIGLWEKTPRYVLLLGDASYDPRNYIGGLSTNILPTYFVQTNFGGQTASDIPFADIDGDSLPDFALGRVPASSLEEVQSFVRKTIDYENAVRSNGNLMQLLAIADGQDKMFREDARNFLNIFSDNYQIQLYSPEAGSTGEHQVIARLLDDGYSIVAYFGHGSVSMWGKDQLFTSENALDLANSDYPILINMTCLTGYFTHPQIESITEAFLFNPNGGAVAVLAPTSLTLSIDQFVLSDALAQELMIRNFERLGDVFLAAQRHLNRDSAGVRDVLATFLLLGDPALFIH